MKIAIICVGVVTLRFRTVPPHGSSNKTRVNRAMYGEERGRWRGAVRVFERWYGGNDKRIPCEK